MKSKLILEIDTRFKQLFKYEEEIGKSPKEKITKETEKSFHNFVYKLVEDIIEELDDYLDDFNDFNDCYFDFDSFGNFGKIKLKLKEQEKNNE